MRYKVAEGKEIQRDLAAHFAAQQAQLRCECFHRVKRIGKLPKKPMTQEVMKQLCG